MLYANKSTTGSLLFTRCVDMTFTGRVPRWTTKGNIEAVAAKILSDHDSVFVQHKANCMATSLHGNIIRVTGPLWWEYIGQNGEQLISLQRARASSAELWCPTGQIVEQIVESPVIWDAIAAHVTSL